MTRENRKDHQVLTFAEDLYEFAQAVGGAIPLVGPAVRIAKSGAKLAASTATLFIGDGLYQRYPNFEAADSVALRPIKADAISTIFTSKPQIYFPNLRTTPCKSTSQPMLNFLANAFPNSFNTSILTVSMWTTECDRETLVSAPLFIFFDDHFLYKSEGIWYRLSYLSPDAFLVGMKGIWKPRLYVGERLIDCQKAYPYSVYTLVNAFLKIERDYVEYVERRLGRDKRTWFKTFEKLSLERLMKF